MSYRINRPVPFDGGVDEAALNRASHNFAFTGGPEDMDARCMWCDCRPSHEAANYPCGAEVPRETVVFRTPDAEQYPL